MRNKKHKTMKRKYFIVPLLFALFFSCTKEMNTETNKTLTTESSLEKFSILLSKAVYSEPELRSFIKTEALQRKDYDYDVFYPYVKDELVDGNRTFEEILLQYDDDRVLSDVLSAHPLLTIYVPDWSWINENCFSVNTWDTTLPDVGTSYSSEEQEHKLYWNGQYAFSLKNGEFCSTPTLIVKDNDRIIAEPHTKSNEVQNYRFYCDNIINLSSKTNLQTKTTSKYYTYDLPYEVASDYISTNVLTNRSKDAFSICSNDSRIFQRDHIYYGMTSNNDIGSVNPNYYETLYRFKLSPNAKGIMDNPTGTNNGTDFKANSYYYEASWGSATKLDASQLASKSWGKGMLDIRIRIYVGKEPIKKNVAVSFGDAFYVKKVELRENYNWLGALKSRTYYLEIDLSKDNNAWLEPKWINANLQLFYWDLSQYATSYIVEFEEYDKATKVTHTTQNTFSFATNFSTNVEGGATIEGITMKRGYGFGVSKTKTKTTTDTVETTEESDNLGSFIVQYTDKIVLSQNNSEAKIKKYTTGDVDAQILTIYE